MKIYNKISVLLAICCFTFTINAQQRVNDQRTNETKIADAVMLLPAKDTGMQKQLMQELIGLDNVIPNLASKLLPPGAGDDSQVRAAISGLAFYASQGNNPADKKKIAGELCKVIPTINSDEIKDFLLIQLQYVAGNESVETAAQYLENERLADAAARVLVRIGNDAAGKAMTAALGKTNNAQKITLIQALGDMRYQPAVGEINALIAGDPKYRKVMLHSLAQIADPSSEKILSQLAESVVYKYESDDVLGSYMLYLKNSLPARKDFVAKSAQNVLKATSETSQFAAKSAALDLYARAASEKAIPEIIKALDSKDEKYRGAALLAASNLQSSKMTDALLKRAKKADSQLKSEIITFFGTTGNKTALPFVLDALKDKSPDVVAAAITAAGKTGQEQAIAPIVGAMKNGTQSVVNAGKDALLTINSDKITAETAKGISNASAPIAVALIDVLAQKKATSYVNQIFPLVTSSNSQIADAATKALKDVVTVNDLPKLSGLLTQISNAEQVSAVQDALYAAVQNSGNANKQTDLILGQMNSSNTKILFYKPLSMIGGDKALKVVSEGFNSADTKTKNAAFDALAGWNGFESARELYSISKNNLSSAYFDKALMSYVNKIMPSKNTNAQKLVLLRDALDIAKTPAQKEEIIKQIAKTGTFLGLITAGKYLDDANDNVQQAAVQTVNTIALAHPEYYGKVVTNLLNKAMQLNKNSEASYQKQAVLKHLAALPQDEGFVSMFNGKDLTGWKGLVDNPILRSKMKPAELAKKQVKADEVMRQDWTVENGMLVYEGKGYDNLCSEKTYSDFELYVDWKIAPEGDAGIYLRGSPQVQIWDTSLIKVGAQVGSGGLYNNQKYESKPSMVADNPVNEWNSFYIRMEGDKVTVYLNGQLVVDNVILENYWDRSLPIFPEDAIELQAHGNRVEYRDIYVKEIPRPQAFEVSASEKKEGFVPMFNGVNLTGWIGNLKDYYAKDGMIICDPERGGHGNLYTAKEYSDFIMRFEFQLTPAANNGLGIRTPIEGDAAYVGMELQILDNDAEVYKDLHIYQYHGSVYGVIPAKRGYLKPVGEWNYQEVIAKGNRITITLNGTVILDGDIAEASKNFTATVDGNQHPGLSNKTGHIGFLGHGSWVAFKNLRIKELK